LCCFNSSLHFFLWLTSSNFSLYHSSLVAFCFCLLGLLRGGVLCHGFHLFSLYTYFHIVIMSFPMTSGLVSNQPKYVYSRSINILHLVKIHFFPLGEFLCLILHIFRIQV
jgi:hypothetical protein